MQYEIDEITSKIHQWWKPFFDENRKELASILDQINSDENEVFPNPKDVFRALFYFGPLDTKLVILGQDPYIGYEIINDMKIPQACGLSFSVPKNHKKIPPSLKNIFKEIDPNYVLPHGSLLNWVKNEKILLLNAALTVIQGKSNSHMPIWSQFTDKLIKYISDKNKDTVFLLMGNFAIKKMSHDNMNMIFKTVHPSPLSAYNGFFGCNVFNKINEYFESKNIAMINWKIN